MSEPRLEDMGDYNTLEGEKKKVVWGVVVAGLLIGVIYLAVYSTDNNKDDVIEVEKTLKNIPMK
ncbi:MAG: hypothetical protein U9N02_05635 [Campylobacterota bacterium]|nr:hypothetical protein [Campylobacterota bacterium]